MMEISLLFSELLFVSFYMCIYVYFFSFMWVSLHFDSQRDSNQFLILFCFWVCLNLITIVCRTNQDNVIFVLIELLLYYKHQSLYYMSERTFIRWVCTSYFDVCSVQGKRGAKACMQKIVHRFIFIPITQLYV